MKNYHTGKTSASSLIEKTSAKVLMDRMGISKKEYHEIINKYGVNASKLIEVMQMSRYQYIH